MSRILPATLVNGQVPVQILPPTSSDERPHVLSEECWCRPIVRHVEARIVHNRRPPVAPKPVLTNAIASGTGPNGRGVRP